MDAPSSRALELSFSTTAMESRLLAPAEEQWDRIKEVLTCPVCFHIFDGPIAQCSNGHSLCELCRKKLRKCPLCRASMTTKCRNFTLETIVSACTYKCRFYDQGCRVKVKGAGDQNHQNVCSFRSVSCASFGFKECQKQSKFNEFISHLSKEHSVRIEDNSFFKKGNVLHRDILIFTTRDRCVDTVIKFDSNLFLLNFEILGDENNCRKLRQLSQEEKNLLPCSWWVSMLDRTREAINNYSCKITMTSSSNLCKKSNGRLSCEGPVVGLRDRNNQTLTTTLANILGKYSPIMEESLRIGFEVPEIRYKINVIISKTTTPEPVDIDTCGLLTYLRQNERIRKVFFSESLIKLLSILLVVACVVNLVENMEM